MQYPKLRYFKPFEFFDHFGKAVVLWNLALDQDHKPLLGDCTSCRGVITVNHAVQPSQAAPTVDFTALAHASKFVAPDAYRVESNTFDEGSLEDVAFAIRMARWSCSS